MNQRTFFIFPILLAFVALFTACDNTPEPAVGPSISLGTGGQFVSDTATVFTDSTFQIQVTASKGDADLRTIEVRENGTAIANTRILIDGFTAGANPSPLFDAALSSFTYVLTITAGSTADETNEYTVIVTDTDGLNASASVDVTTKSFGTFVTERNVILLLNQAGPAGQGGLDLESGNSIGTNNDSADIRDMGIDLALPNASNWKQQIGTINTSVLKVPAAGLNYDEILTKEQLRIAYDAGQSFTTSDKVAEGDLFLALTSEGNYYLLKTDAITVTPNDNSDRYEFSVKN